MKKDIVITCKRNMATIHQALKDMPEVYAISPILSAKSRTINVTVQCENQAAIDQFVRNLRRRKDISSVKPAKK